MKKKMFDEATNRHTNIAYWSGKTAQSEELYSRKSIFQQHLWVASISIILFS